MADEEWKNESQSFLSERKEKESLSTGSSLDDDTSSPRSCESDWSFSTLESNDEDQNAKDIKVDHGNAPKSSPSSSIVDGLLFEIYDRYHARESVDSDNITECSTTSGSVFGGSFDLEDRELGEHWTKSDLQVKDLEELHSMVKEIRTRISMLSAKLVKQLKRRDKNAYKLQKNFDILTAILQAVSPKRRIDTRIRFSYIPQSGKKAFRQWLDAYKAVARLPQGVPAAWRKRLWLCLADSKLADIDWKKTVKFCFNEKSNPDDDNLGSQIVKDLHRTGCGWFCNQDTPEERAVLKRVLLAYARWNKSVGYCQGFNVIAALILQVMERVEEDALKVMIYLVDHILPVNYFSNNLRALSVDMAVLRDLMRVKLPRLSKHLDDLQAQAHAQTQNGSGTVYEPPLINVFTMQWFLTLFATCLPEETVLRVWDCILLEGSEVLLRVALAMWAKIGKRLENVETADEFYSTMGVVIQDVLAGSVVDGRSLTQSVYSLAPFPLPGLVELKEKYTYNIHPFSGVDQARGSSRPGLANLSSDEEDEDADLENIGCLGVLMPFSDISTNSAVKGLPESENNRHDAGDIASASPGVFATDSYAPLPYTMRQFNSRTAQRVQHELSYLQKQYARMRQMQQQAVVVFTEATVKQIKESDKPKTLPSAINHLFVSATRRKNNRAKSPQSEGASRSPVEEPRIADAKQPEPELNIHERESRQHLNELFRGECSGHRENKHDAVNKTNSALKLKHTGLNGEISSISVTSNEPETAAFEKTSADVGSINSSPGKITLIDSVKLSRPRTTVPSNVEILDRNSPSVFASSKEGRITATKTARMNNQNSNVKLWMLEEDSRCTYPTNFKPFPQRSKSAPRSKVLYGKISDKGSKRMDAFRARFQPVNGGFLGENSS